MFRGWTVLSITLLYDFFTVTGKHFRKIGKGFNIAGRTLALAASIFFFIGVRGASDLTTANHVVYIVTDGIVVNYNVLRWLFLIFPTMIIVEENLMINKPNGEGTGADTSKPAAKAQSAATRERN